MKRKREQEAEPYSLQDQDWPGAKKPRSHPLSYAAERDPKQEVEGDGRENDTDPLLNWIETKRWPSKYFEQDGQARKDFFEHDSSLEEQMEWSSIPVVQYVEINGFKYPRPIRKVPSSLRRKQSDMDLSGSSGQKRGGSKSAPYRDTRYPTLLAAQGSYMEESILDITHESLTWCKTLLTSEQTVPRNSLFGDDVFKTTCRKVQDRNGSRVICSITQYIVPSAEDLETLGATQLGCLVENVNEAWTGSIPLEGPQPQPDYCVGFRRSAFTDEQLNRLDPFIGTVFDTSYFVANYRMYFPFLTCEVKCGAAALDIADRQNAHSMTLAVRGIVEFFKIVKREKELHQEILAFSISHDQSVVRIYGHYPIIDDDKTTFYRHQIRHFSFTELGGREKWTAYKFTKNVYDAWMPTHLKRICSVIDQLPSNIDFGVSQGSELQFAETSGPSQNTDRLSSEDPDVESASN